MEKTKLVKKMLDSMAESNKRMDLNAYSLGLSNMFDELQKLNLNAYNGKNKEQKESLL